MRRGRDPSRTPSRPRRPVWDNPRGQLPGTDIRGDGENLYGGNLFGSSTQGVSGNSSGGVAVTGKSSSGRSLPVNVLGNGSGGASSGGQASACAGEERPSLFSDSGNVFLISILLQRLLHHLVQQNSLKLDGRKDPYEETKYRGAGIEEVRAWWNQFWRCGCDWRVIIWIRA